MTGSHKWVEPIANIQWSSLSDCMVWPFVRVTLGSNTPCHMIPHKEWQLQLPLPAGALMVLKHQTITVTIRQFHSQNFFEKVSWILILLLETWALCIIITLYFLKYFLKYFNMILTAHYGPCISFALSN